MYLSHASASPIIEPMMNETTHAARATPSRNELLKQSCPTLAGTISQTLAEASKDRFSDDDYEFLKFHGIYQQDDRDKRKVARQYIYMVRGRLPGGVVKPSVYLAFDRLCDLYANHTLRITTRQAFQFHGVTKGGLGKFMKGLNDALATTLGACGDVSRNVMAAPTPATSPLVDEVQRHAALVSDELLPKTRAYHQIWVEGVEMKLTEADAHFVDPLYGKAYLPRKFKVAFAIPPLNDVDVLTNDCGFIAIAENGRLAGYNLAAGGGMGMSHGNARTYPRLADVVCLVKPCQAVEAAKAAVTIHRDFSDRTNRKHARLKYLIQERGVEWFRAELARRLGFQPEPARPFQFTRRGDLYGWHKQLDGNYFLGLFVQSGRIKDADGCFLKTGLRKVVEQFQPELRLTPSQNILLIDVESADREGITRVFAEHGVAVENQGGPVRLASMACPALPTCGLALAESERVLPDILARIENLLAQAGIPGEEIIFRMTGCPNGCARPLMAELSLVGRAPGKYQIYLGGNASGTRLARLFKESVKNEDLTAELRPLFEQFARERRGAERFGDFCERVILTGLNPVASGHELEAMMKKSSP
jgi:sulfite reductase (NADPH) hemoprotein beta-component